MGYQERPARPDDDLDGSSTSSTPTRSVPGETGYSFDLALRRVDPDIARRPDGRPRGNRFGKECPYQLPEGADAATPNVEATPEANGELW